MPTESATDTALDAVLTLLNVSSFTSITPGGVSQNPPTGTPYPAAWITAKEADTRTLSKMLATVDVQVHVFAARTAQDLAWPVVRQAVILLDGTTPSLTNWTSLLFLYDRTYRLPDETIAGASVAHIVASFMMTAQQT